MQLISCIINFTEPCVDTYRCDDEGGAWCNSFPSSNHFTFLPYNLDKCARSPPLDTQSAIASLLTESQIASYSAFCLGPVAAWSSKTAKLHMMSIQSWSWGL